MLVLGTGSASGQDVELDPMSRVEDERRLGNRASQLHRLPFSQSSSRNNVGVKGQWLQMIRWMQAKQNLWQFDPDTENRIVTYLAENYPPQDDRRRMAIPPRLMPPNPYAPPTKEPDNARESL